MGKRLQQNRANSKKRGWLKIKITDIIGREVLDSRGNPTVEVEILTDVNIKERFSVPSGASTGIHEAVELRDGDKTRFNGKGVTKAVANVNEKIRPCLIGESPLEQKRIDDLLIKLDGTENKSALGANAILATSVACAKVATACLNLPLYSYLGGPDARVLPVPMMNVINGGRHADSGLDIQEYMLMPLGAKNFHEAVRMVSETFYALRDILKSRGYSTGVGDEGGFAPKLSSNEEALQVLVEAITKAKYRPGKDACIAIDVAASEFYDNGKYTLALEKDFKNKSAADLVEYYQQLVKKYPIVSIEDGMAEDDWKGWQLLSERLCDSVQLVGDDLFTTKVTRLQEGIKQGVANAIIVKPNQIGTLSETLWLIEVAKRNNYSCIISNRSAETGETLLASLAVACNSGQIKAGSICRGERTSNYNQLMRIEEYLGNAALYEGFSVFHNLKTIPCSEKSVNH